MATGWRNQETHADETNAVRAALAANGINARVKHGRGTAWGWLKINIGAGQQWGEHVRNEASGLCEYECPRCVALRQLHTLVIEISMKVTGRSSSDRMLVMTQDAWNKQAGKSEPITHAWQPIVRRDTFKLVTV